MESSVFARFVVSLRNRKNALLAWMQEAPPDEMAIRLGRAGTDAVNEHLGVLEQAILRAKEGELGRCSVCHEFVEKHWLETDFTTSVCIDHLSGPERSRLESELELSQKVQKALLPQQVPQISGWELASFSRPASIVGGDYFDFARLRNGHHALVIADVMGKGMPASLLMASLQASLRIIIPESTSPASVLERVNQVFCHNINLTKFVTLVVAALDPDSGSLLYANAGHNPPLLLDGGTDGRWECLMPTGAAIGLLEHAEFTERSVRLGHGATLVFYTDGIVEAGAGTAEMYGEERLRTFLLRNRQHTAPALVRGLLQDVLTFNRNAPPGDDTTVIVLKRTAHS